MGKNVVIYSDGTGQRSGLFFDINRSNIYKLYRATRCGPDNEVDPAEQLTFYDPRYMHLYPDPTGPQHDERRSLVFRYAGVKARDILPEATLHESVVKRFEAPTVLQYNVMKPYRPTSLQ